MKRLIYNSEDIFAMSDVRGRKIKVESKVGFSFYYSPKNSSHGPRVKVSFNPEKLRIDQTGTLKLCDDWEFNPGGSDRNVSGSEINKMKEFFRKYLVLFLLVWDKQLADEPLLGDYFEGDADLSGLIKELDFYEDYKEDLDNISTVSELEGFCRENDLVNFYGN